MQKISSFEEYQQAYTASIENPEKFWATIASFFTWKKPFTTTVKWEFDTPSIEWFLGGELNITENCLDRHLPLLADKKAIIWESNFVDVPSISYTYQELYEEVNKVANALKSIGIQKGDRVGIYLPMVPELAITVLACARIGAIHSVVFAGFSAQALSDRLNDAQCSLLITADIAYRGDKTILLKTIVNEAITITPSIKNVVVLNRNKELIEHLPTDIDYKTLVASQSNQCEATAMQSEDPLFILYTSGSTGKPKGVLHTTAGYMVYTAYTFLNVFQYEPSDIHFCTADIGWITGHSYLLYAPLLNGATTILYEGIPTYPTPARLWEIIEKHQATILYTAPTAIRSLMTYDDSYTATNDLSSLRVLGSVGEPINVEAWNWYYQKIGKSKLPIVDTWWQTETGGILISSLAGITPMKPTYATLPLPGVQPMLVNEKGEEIIGNGVSGNLCLKYPIPSMIRTTYNNPIRCKEAYFSTYPNLYFTGDGCYRDEDGNYRITGRVDDVLNIAGHRIGTAEVEDAINQHESSVESAVVGIAHAIKGQQIVAFVISSLEIKDEALICKQIQDSVSKLISPIAKPDQIILVPALPKTRSGKIMRRILRKIAEKQIQDIGDTSTLIDASVVDTIAQLYNAKY